ncbi:MAG: hypothetical protein JW939_06760 [Candidatus Thermoplasmatota archaeon]|nr:hypothetical protein [Candidatus Thermoplasmatota archaeon]
MGFFFWDVFFGALLVVSISASVVGLLAYRYRRGAGPLLLAVSGIPGVVASVLFILESSGALEVPLWIPIASLALFAGLILIAVAGWRGRS